jgi:Rps23 Pro-64 3,4-dihydroxylase Tpa1-like proline 4-hydroxylase
MKFTYCTAPFEHLIIDDFFTEEELVRVWREIDFLAPKLAPPAKTYTSTDKNGTHLKAGSGLMLDEVYAQRGASDILQINRKLFSPEVLNAFASLHPAYAHCHMCDLDNTLLNCYRNGDYYNSHTDKALFSTVTFMFREPRAFEGGDFVFTDYAHTVETVPNRVVMFPGCISHEVTPLSTNTDDLQLARYSLAGFMFVKT